MVLASITLKYVVNRSEEFDRVFQAMADPSRRAIVERLVRGPASVSQLAEPLPMSLPGVVQHLSVLESAGVVVVGEGRPGAYCRLKPGVLRRAESWLGAQRTAWERPPRPTRCELSGPDEQPRHRPQTSTKKEKDPMTDRSVTHTTFTLERTYPVSPDQVFAAWAAPEVKARWFAGNPEGYELDFRPGGIERNLAATKASRSPGNRCTARSSATSGSSTPPCSTKPTRWRPCR